VILPWLKGLLSFQRAPLTWTLIALNIFVYFITYQPENPAFEKIFSKKDEIVLTGRLYNQYQENLRNRKVDLWELKVKSADEYLILGGMALRDPQFLREAEKFSFVGDDVAIGEWKKWAAEYQSHYEHRNTHLFGLKSEGGIHSNRALTWITYQFMHSGLIHLFSNMALLFIFGGALELIAGSFFVVIIYLVGGMAGALGFVILSKISLVPMIGASGAISAVMAAYAAAESRLRVPYFFFLSPIEGYYGLIYLPTWLIFPLCFLPDIANYLATPEVFGSGVAYSAHMGGALLGAALGFVFKIIHSNKRNRFRHSA
jgi:membrane associated rhomboid family serine protease